MELPLLMFAEDDQWFRMTVPAFLRRDRDGRMSLGSHILIG
jgi:hypothetical protein